MSGGTEDINKDYWLFINLIIRNPNLYLKTEGKLIYSIVEGRGSCKSITQMAKILSINKNKAYDICSTLRKLKHIELTKEQGRKIIMFAENAKAKGVYPG